MKQINTDIMRKMILNAADSIIQNEPVLTDLDNTIGDGDHGRSMKRGFGAVRQYLSDHRMLFLSELCYATGLQLVKSMGGASGVIFGTMFMGGEKWLKDKKEADLITLAEYFLEGEKEIERRGGARTGCKTMIDALYPACIKLKQEAQNHSDMLTAFREAAMEAHRGAEETKAMESLIGRSRNFGKSAIGIPDPGAVSVSIIWDAFYKTIEEEEND